MPDGNTISCFAAGTRIATPTGRVPVEQLQEGDLVQTLEGGAAIRWIGRRHVECRRHPAPEKVRPVRIAAHAFAMNQPVRDLFLSPDHAIFVDRVLIPIRYLINESTIAQEDVDTVQYFHVELDRHGVVLAEGLPGGGAGVRCFRLCTVAHHRRRGCRSAGKAHRTRLATQGEGCRVIAATA